MWETRFYESVTDPVTAISKTAIYNTRPSRETALSLYFFRLLYKPAGSNMTTLLLLVKRRSDQADA